MNCRLKKLSKTSFPHLEQDFYIILFLLYIQIALLFIYIDKYCAFSLYDIIETWT